MGGIMSSLKATADQNAAPSESSVGTASHDIAVMPLPTDPRVFFQAGMFLMGFFACLYFTREIALPITLAFALKPLLQTAVRVGERLGLPRLAAVLLVVSTVLASLGGLGAALSGPAGTWADKLPESIPRLQERLSFLSEPIKDLRQQFKSAEESVQGDRPAVAPETPGASLFSAVFAETKDVTVGLFTTTVVLIFALMYGDVFLRRLVEVLPRFHDKRQAVEISEQIQRDISIHLVTITVVNGAVGATAALIMWICGVGDPLLWGAIAFLLNFIPVLGPLVVVVIFLMAGLLSVDTLWQALLPGALYFGVHLFEGQSLTPMLLAKRFTLNPLLVVLALIFWFWMWGVIGAILAVPMLAVTKIVCDRVPPLAAIGHFLEG